MTPLTGLIVLVGSSSVLWLALVSLAVARKLRRDRRELRSGERRARNESALRSKDGAALAAICSERLGAAAQVDLARSIDAVYPSLSPAQVRSIGRVMAVSPLFDSLTEDLRSRRPITRARAALLLTRPGLASTVDRIAPLLGDPDPDVRLVACSGLARAATPRAADVLIQGLVEQVLPAERIVERLGSRWAVEPILVALCRETSQIHASLAQALGLAGDPRGTNALVELLGSDSEEIRISAARALGRVGRTACVPKLIATLETDSWPVRAQAATSLGALRATDAIEPLEECLSDRAWWVRTNAAYALREIGEPGIEALERTLRHADPYAADRAREQLALQSVIEEQAAA
jgi:HEAT repeat protein